MNEEQGGQPEHERSSVIDPSVLRGLTQRRISRRSALAAVGASGLGAFLAACGVQGQTASGGSTPAGGVGTAAWWAKQKLHHTVNFANWPYYIDVLNGKHPRQDNYTKTTGNQVT